MNGKGSARRPHDVPTDTVADNWARTFGKTPCPHDRTLTDIHGNVFCPSCGYCVGRVP